MRPVCRARLEAHQRPRGPTRTSSYARASPIHKKVSLWGPDPEGGPAGPGQGAGVKPAEQALHVCLAQRERDARLPPPGLGRAWAVSRGSPQSQIWMRAAPHPAKRSSQSTGQAARLGERSRSRRQRERGPHPSLRPPWLRGKAKASVWGHTLLLWKAGRPGQLGSNCSGFQSRVPADNGDDYPMGFS